MDSDALLSFVEDFRSGILRERPSYMQCFKVCWPLQALLDINGVKTVMMEGIYKAGDRNHIWLECVDGTVIDPTADQFGGPTVYIGPAIGMYATGRPWG